MIFNGSSASARGRTGVSPEETVRVAGDFEFLVLFTSKPGFHHDVRLAEKIKEANPAMKIAFDDDTWAWGKARVIELCRHLKELNFTWSCNSRVHADYDMLKAMKEAGCRLLVVGFESGVQEVLNNVLPQARHEILLMLDSDIRVEPGFLRAISDELPPDGGLVTCLYRAGEAPGIPSKLEAVGISSEFAPGVLVAQMAGGMSFALGAAIAVTRKALEAGGGFKAMAPYLADDYMMGKLVQKAGLPVRLSGCIVETVLSRLTLSSLIRHQIKWARCIRACAPWGHTGSVIMYGTALSFLYFIAWGFSGFALSIFACVCALRLWAAWMIGVRRLGDKILRQNLLLVPLRDFLGLFLWSAALLGKRVEWRGRVLQLEEGGRIKPCQEKTP